MMRNAPLSLREKSFIMNSLPFQGKDASHTDILLYLISDLLAPDLWHLHTSDQNMHSHTDEIKQAPQMVRGTAQREASLRGWRAMKEDRMVGHGRNSERWKEERG